MAVTARSPTSMERKMRLLTVLWVPAHGVQVEVAVVEEELVIDQSPSCKEGCVFYL